MNSQKRSHSKFTKKCQKVNFLVCITPFHFKIWCASTSQQCIVQDHNVVSGQCSVGLCFAKQCSPSLLFFSMFNCTKPPQPSFQNAGTSFTSYNLLYTCSTLDSQDIYQEDAKNKKWQEIVIQYLSAKTKIQTKKLWNYYFFQTSYFATPTFTCMTILSM